MDTKQNDKEWGLIRNNNGEWVSVDNAVFVSELEKTIIEIRAAQLGKKITFHHGPDNSLWYYKQEAADIFAAGSHRTKITYRKLNIKKAMDSKKFPLKYSGDKLFKRNARKHQSDFRTNVLNAPFDSNHKFGKYGAFLMPEDAKNGKNFCEAFRPEILDCIKLRYPQLTITKRDELFANMLRSEHIPWNLFVPMMQDYKATAQVFNDILGNAEIDEITDIRIEWAPDKTVCMNDNTSFDTYIEYLNDGKKCGIGIEVKYTEEGYPFGVKERKEVMEKDDSKYACITRSCGLFIPEIAEKPIRETPLCENSYRQIWRNHILGASMINNKDLPKDMIENFHSITIYPKGNPHFGNVLPEYEKFLTDKGKSSFGYITIEDLIDLIEKYFPKTEKFQNWIQYLKQRYPF